MVTEYLLFLLKRIPFLRSFFVDEYKELWDDDLTKSFEYQVMVDPPDYEQARKYLLRAIKLGYPDGDRELAYLYEYHLHDSQKALYHYQQCAKQGDAECLGLLGQYFLHKKNLPESYHYFYDYMRHAAETDLNILYVRSYLVLSILKIAMEEKSTIDFLDKCKVLERELLDDKKKYHNSFAHQYESFSDLPDQAKSVALEFFAEHEIIEYEQGVYDVVYYWNDEVYKYLLSIFSYGFMLPEKSQRPFFDVVLSSSDPILFVTFEI